MLVLLSMVSCARMYDHAWLNYLTVAILASSQQTVKQSEQLGWQALNHDEIKGFNMKSTNPFDDEYDEEGDALPPMRPCSTAAAATTKRAKKTKVGRRITFVEDSDDDQTIHSSSLYSLRNYSPAARKAKQKKKDEKGEPSAVDYLCGLSDVIIEEVEGTLEDTVTTFKQVIYAFAISGDDIEGIVDTINDGIDDARDMYEIELERLRS